MARFILLTFGVLACAWYYLSGGSDFQPASSAKMAQADVDAKAPGADLTPVERVMPSASFEAEDVAIVPVTLTANSTFTPAVRKTVQQTSEVAAVAATADQAPAPSPASPKVVASVEPVAKPVLDQAPVEAVSLISRRIEAVVAPENAPYRDVRYVTGTRVNVRSGPGTGYSVVAKMFEGDEVEVIDMDGAGWIKIRMSETNRVGWMADWLVTAAN